MLSTPDLPLGLPAVALHDHLDGGLRPATVLDLGRQLGHTSPASTEQGVADWFHDQASSGSLPDYLSTFAATLPLLQSRDALQRIAREFVEDMVDDGVVYAETRWAPHQHVREGLTLDGAVQAVQDGLDEGVATARAAGRPIVVGQLLAYLRHEAPTEDLLRIARERQGRGVVGLDLAGPEAGHPAARFADLFRRARAEGLHVTIHAGEADGVDSIAQALEAGAQRIGHGARLVEDLGPSWGPTAHRIHRERICLELCPSSNLQTGAASDLVSHPAGALHREGFAVAISSDNRLMSRTRTSRELQLLAAAHQWGLEDLETLTLTALAAGFAPRAQREALREDVVLPAFAAARAEGHRVI